MYVLKHKPKKNKEKKQIIWVVKTTSKNLNLAVGYSHKNNGLHASYAGSDGAWWRRCAAHDDEKVRIATNNQETQNY